MAQTCCRCSASNTLDQSTGCPQILFVKKLFMSKVAVVLGYGPGVGACILESLLREEAGFKVALVARRIDDLEAVAAEWNSKGKTVKAFAGR